MTIAPEPADSTPPGSIQVVTRAALLLRTLHDHPDGIGLSKLATAVALPRSTVHRLLVALQVEGFVATARNGQLVLGPELLRLAGRDTVDLPTLLRPTLEALSADLDETVDLAVREGDHLRFIDQIPAPHRLRAVSAVGVVFPLHCTANGKAALATMSDSEIKQLIPERLERYTAQTITSREALLEELAVVRSTGLATDREEHTDGICAMGFATETGNGTHAAITVPVPTQRFVGREKAIAAALDQAREQAREALAFAGRGGDLALLRDDPDSASRS